MGCVKKLNKKEICLILSSMEMDFNKMYEEKCIDIYHKHEWDHGYDGYTGFSGTRRQFYFDFIEIMNFLEDYIKQMNIREVILTPLHQCNYFNGVSDIVEDIYTEINDFLKLNSIDKRYESGLRVNIKENWDIITAICEGAFRDISNIVLVFEEDSSVFVPHHHMNYIIYSKHLKEKEKILKEIISRHKNIQMYVEK